MLTILAFAAAVAAQDPGSIQGPVIIGPDPRQGPMPYNFGLMAPSHRGSDDRMFPDIAIGELRIEGDTLYVQVRNVGHSATQGGVTVEARAEENGMNTEPAQARTGRLRAGEARWVPLRGFSVRTASNAAPVFALANATEVSATAMMQLAATPALDRSGQGRQDMFDMDEKNNSVTLEGSAIKHGRP
jgi:hypothetical protein